MNAKTTMATMAPRELRRIRGLAEVLTPLAYAQPFVCVGKNWVMNYTQVLIETIRELDEHVSGAGWDQNPRLFAIVPTADVAQDHPELVIEDHLSQFMFIEQDAPLDNENLMGTLEQISWPDEVHGVALTIERLIATESDDELDEVSIEHDQEIRVLALVMRTGDNVNGIRQRSHDEADDLAVASDLVPALNAALLQTLSQ